MSTQAEQQQQDQTAEQPEQPVSAEERAARDKAAAEGMSNLDAIVKATIDRRSIEMQTFELHQRQARLFAGSGLFDGAKNKSVNEAIATYFTLIEIGEGMGFTAAQSVMGIDIIQGRPAVSAQLRAARCSQLGYSWRITWLEDKGECVGCELWPFYKGKQMTEWKKDAGGNLTEVPLCVSYTKSDATRMLTTVYKNQVKTRVSILEKDNWKMSPRNMYFARCATNFQRWYVPHAIASNALDPDEVEDVKEELFTPIPKNGSAEAAAKVLADKLAAINAEKGFNGLPDAAVEDEKTAEQPTKQTPQPGFYFGGKKQ